MSKKKERIGHLIGCRKALNTQGEMGADGKLCYDFALIKQVLKTMDHLLKLDGITGIPADAKFGINKDSE